MYDITREKASEILNLSTRSIDRYIKSWKLRSIKKWKIVYINNEDVENLSKKPNNKQVIITKNKDNDINQNNDLYKKIDESNILKIYDSIKNQIKEKDSEIMNLNKKIWSMEEIIKNSIPIIEFKKSQFLLEESNNTLNIKIQNAKKHIDELKKKNDEISLINTYLIILSFVLFITLLIIIFIKI